ncbi:MAG: twin-arginine translocase subunit TatC [Kiritimatiellaeota bacterium]|nr:twin-arginine translocase subunit TatC [Kiritimatiellota bacterium]
MSATHLAGGINSALTSVNGVSSLVSLTYVLAGNLATVSTEHLQNGTTAGTVFTLTSLDWGAYVNGIQAKVGEGSDSGYKLTVEFSDEDITEVFDNLADSAAIVAAVNDPASGSMLVSAVKDADGTPSSAVFAPLEDGSDGTTVNQDWSDCFALMGASGADIYDAVTSDTGVIDLLVAAALVVAENHGCMVVAGHAASQTVAQVKAVQAPYAANFRLRIVTPGFLLRNSRYAILIIVILAAIVTPTPDVFNLMLFAVPMCLLFYVGIFAGYLLVLSREGKRFPWRIVLYVLLVALAVLAAVAYVAITKYGYKLVLYWPFVTK